MLVYKSALKLNKSRNVSLQTVRNFLPKSWIPGIVKEEEDEIKPGRQLKKWRKNSGDEIEASKGILSMFSSKSPRNEFPLFLGRGSMPRSSDLKAWWANKAVVALDNDHQFLPERHQTLGNDLAVAHFVVSRGGKIRKVGDENFITFDDILELPSTFVSDWYIEEVDFSNVEISYKGLVNFKGLRFLKKLTFKNCQHFDDWCLERIVTLCSNIKHLDVSDCEKITEKGLECLYRAWELEEFVVTDYYQNPAFELTCLMVEDCMPGVTIKRLTPSPKNEIDMTDYKHVFDKTNTDIKFKY